MRARRQLTLRKFERRHPDVSLIISEKLGCVSVAATEAEEAHSGEVIARRTGPAGSRDRLLWELSQAVLTIRRLEVARTQEYRDAQTGEIKPLEFHHIRFRSHGGTHARRNLAGLSADTHRKRHEQRAGER